MTRLDQIFGAALAAALMAGMVWASNAPLTAHRSPDSILRLAWSARPERVEDCRQRSPEELARLPQHMRQPIVCEGTTAEYRLQVRIDGRLVADRVVHGGGLRRDRRLYVFEEVALPPGEAAIDVRFDRIQTGQPATAGAGSAVPHPAQQPTPAQRGEVPAHLSVEQRLRFASREVILVTYDSDRRQLIIRGLGTGDQGSGTGRPGS
jgi:hypothetical protein